MSKPRALVSWSSGKDSAWTLHVLWQRAEYDVVGLVTTVNRAFGRVAMHAVPVALLEAQAEAVGVTVVDSRDPAPLCQCAVRSGDVAVRGTSAITGSCSCRVRRPVFGGCAALSRNTPRWRSDQAGVSPVASANAVAGGNDGPLGNASSPHLRGPQETAGELCRP